MRKGIAILGSVLFTAAAFLFCWKLLASGSVSNTFLLWGFPLFAGSYFVLAGELFCRKLQLRRICLWLWMNGAGYPLGWVLLCIWRPVLLYNLIIVPFLFLMTISLALFWVLLALVMFAGRWLARQKERP